MVSCSSLMFFSPQFLQQMERGSYVCFFWSTSLFHFFFKAAVVLLQKQQDITWLSCTKMHNQEMSSDCTGSSNFDISYLSWSHEISRKTSCSKLQTRRGFLPYLAYFLHMLSPQLWASFMLGIKSFSLFSFYLIYLDVPCGKPYLNCKNVTCFYVVLLLF